MLNKVKCFFYSCLMLGLTSSASASLIGGSDIITAPTLISDDSGAINWAQQGFDEAQNVLLSSNLQVREGTIAANTRVDSHMIFLNTPNNNRASDTQRWTFGGDILGIIDARGTLTQTHSFLGHQNTTYQLDFNNVGLEGGDSYSFTNNILDLTMVVTEPGDWIRVITEASVETSPVPVPSAVWLFGTALFGFVGIRKKQ